jgi:class 3 adenylate cyclase/tetratricopeptide (TPR) repeat protein
MSERASLLLAYVPRHVSAEILRAPSRSPVGVAHRFEAAALFADISGFTPMSERLGRLGGRGTEELTVLLNTYFGVLISSIESYGGIVGKFGGDALTVLFPARGRRDLAAERAVACGLQMQAATARFAELKTSGGVFSFRLKVGTAVGRVLSTTVGLPDVRLEYVIAGEALQLCAEAEHAAAPGEVVAHASVPAAYPELLVERRPGPFVRVLGLPRAPRRVRATPRRSPPDPAARTLSAYLPSAIADRVRAGHAAFVNEHRTIVVLFVAFEPFAYEEPEAAAELQEYFARVVATIARFDGHLRQIDVGDKGSKYIVLFGAPIAHENDPERALRCALELQRLRGARTAGIGIAAGLTYCGVVGAPTRREYAAVGDTVNLAARLMQAAGQGRILVTGLADGRLDAFQVGTTLALTVKGKDQPVSAFELEGLAPTRRMGLLQGGAYGLPLVGREAELRRARDGLKAAVSGHGRVLTVEGEAGIGKSRLAAEIVGLSTPLGFRTYGGSCEAHAAAISYSAWHDVWRAFFGVEPSWDSVRQVEVLTGELERVDDGLVQRLPLLAPALNISLPDNDLSGSLDPELRRELLTSLLVSCVRHRAAETPLLFVLEDCHWIDPLSDELAAALARGTGTARVALLLTSRRAAPEMNALAWCEGFERLIAIELRELDSATIEALLSHLLGQLFGLEDVQRETVAHLIDRADGNPFYLEELVKLLEDRGIDPLDANAVASLDLPDSLQSLSLARIDTLSEETKTPLKVASVIGRLFKAFWVWGAYPSLGDPAKVRGRLEDLTRLGLTVPAQTEPDLEYLFRHVVIRDAAYSTLTYALRSDLHEHVGHFIESTYLDRLDEFIDMLAYHFGESSALDKQRTYFRRAAEAARAVYANDAAIGYFERLLPLTEGSERSDVLTDLGELWQLTGRWTEAEEALNAAVEVAAEEADSRRLATSRAALGRLLAHRGSFAGGRALLEQADEALELVGDSAARVRVLEHLAFVAWQQSDHTASLGYSAEHLRLARELGDEIAACMAIEQEGLVRWHRGEYDRAQALFEHALRDAARVGHPRGVIHASNDLAGLHYELGQYAIAFERVREGLEAAEEIGYRPAIGWMIGNAGELYRHHGDMRQAHACYATAIALMSELRDWRVLLINVGNLGVAVAAQGEWDRAEKLLGYAVRLARAIENPYHLCEFAYHQARVLAEQDESRQAAALNDEALALAEQIERRDVRLPSELLAARLRVACGALTPSAAGRELDALASRWPEPREQAAIEFERWRSGAGGEKARRRASELHRTLHAQQPDVEHALRYAELTGRSLPPPPPLPPLVQAAGQVNVDLLLAELPGVVQEVARTWTPFSG